MRQPAACTSHRRQLLRLEEVDDCWRAIECIVGLDVTLDLLPPLLVCSCVASCLGRRFVAFELAVADCEVLGVHVQLCGEPPLLALLVIFLLLPLLLMLLLPTVMLLLLPFMPLKVVMLLRLLLLKLLMGHLLLLLVLPLLM